jgi:hypothetical protein
LACRAALLPELGWIDSQCGFKLWWSSDLRNVISHLRVFQYKRLVVDGKSANVNSGFDVECLLVALNLGIGIKGINVEWEHHGTPRVNAVRDAKRGLADLIAIWKMDMRGAYDRPFTAVQAG